MTKKEIKELTEQIISILNKRGLDIEIVLDESQLNQLADSIVDKLLTNYIKEQATWYATSTMDEIYNTFRNRPNPIKRNQESELLGELAKLMTKLDYHTDREEFEICAEIKKEIDIVNNKLSKL